MRRPPRGPAVVYGGLTIAVLIAIATLALTTHQPPPPAIAEFAPQARHQIRQAPLQQTSAIGTSPGAGTGAGTTTTSTTVAPTSSTAPPATVDVAAVHQCYGSPPRQISFDTQSPPCVAYWVGDNGGATSAGVTGNEIQIALLSNGGDARAISDLETFFNRTFEFYGRQLHFLWLGQGPSSSYSGDSCTYQRSVVDELSARYHPFAATDPDTSAPSCFLDEAALDHIITASGYPWFTSAQLAARAPYLWQYQMAYDNEFAAAGRMMCTDLAGHDASYAPSRLIAAQPRKFGAILQYIDGQPAPSTAPLAAELARCGTRLASTVSIEADESTSSTSLAQDLVQVTAADKEAVLNMEASGATTVFCWCQVFMEDGLPVSADLQGYDPEWLVLGPQQDLDTVVKLFWADPSQERALMGMTFAPKQLAYPDTTLNEAVAEVDPGYQVGGMESTWIHTEDVYWMLLEIASGIQMAGPDLTPATFQHALQATQFPNPSSPAMEGSVGFGGASLAMTDDAALMWWSPTGLSPLADGGFGTWCYVGGGTRYGLASWPAAPPPLFQGPCDG